jgi:hypothetical protein
MTAKKLDPMPDILVFLRATLAEDTGLKDCRDACRRV